MILLWCLGGVLVLTTLILTWPKKDPPSLDSTPQNLEPALLISPAEFPGSTEETPTQEPQKDGTQTQTIAQAEVDPHASKEPTLDLQEETALGSSDKPSRRKSSKRRTWKPVPRIKKNKKKSSSRRTEETHVSYEVIQVVPTAEFAESLGKGILRNESETSLRSTTPQSEDRILPSLGRHPLEISLSGPTEIVLPTFVGPKSSQNLSFLQKRQPTDSTMELDSWSVPSTSISSPSQKKVSFAAGTLTDVEDEGELPCRSDPTQSSSENPTFEI